MIKQHKHYFIPDTHDAVIWRYFKINRLESLLEDKALYFSRADLLGDDHEGSVTDATIKNRPIFYAGAPESFIQSGAAENAKNEAKCAYISCWHLSSSESVAMWKQYTEDGKGVALRTKVSLLKRSILDEEAEFLFSEVKYVDYDAYPISEWSVFEPLFHKRDVHQHESELRLIKHRLEDLGMIASGNKSPVEGLLVPVDLNTLVDALIISPYVSQRFANQAKRLISKFSLESRLSNSSILRQPTF